MTILEMYQPTIEAALQFGKDNGLNRLKIETAHFDFDFKLTQDNTFSLVSTKAVVKAIGKTSKVPIGEGTPYQTYEQAYEATKKHWQQYFKAYRDTYQRSPATTKADKRHQREYQQRRRDKVKTIEQRQ